MDFYANIANSYGGTGHAGTEEDPFSFADLNDYSGSHLGDQDHYYIKGSRIDTNGSLGVGDNTWDSWNPSVNGPWRYRCTTSEISFNMDSVIGLLKDAIIQIDSGSVVFFSNNTNCTFINLGPSSQAFLPFAGLSLGSSYYTSIFVNGDIVHTYQDCVVVGDITTDNSGNFFTFINCAIKGEIYSTDYSVTNCQTDWAGTAKPAWDGGQATFSDLILAVGITVPPNPGNSPYTGYEQGLWGTTRYGIGAMFFAGKMYFTDCLLGSATDTTGVVFTNCAIDRAPSFCILTNCQTGWVQPSPPAWDGPRELFKIDVLATGTTIPPQFGNPPYTGYEKGLWDTTRTGIGAADFEIFPKYWINPNFGLWNDSGNWSDTSDGYGGAVVPSIFHNVYFLSSGWPEVTSDVLIKSLIMTAGTLNLNGRIFSTLENLVIQGDALLLRTGLTGSHIAIGGDATITGTSISYMDLLADGPWELVVNGSAIVTYVNVANSNVSRGSVIEAYHSGDGLYNYNWNFHPDIPPNSVNYFRLFPTRTERSVISRIVPGTLLERAASAGGGVYFDSTSKIVRVDLLYWDSNFREKKRLIHVGANLEGEISWSTLSSAGVWQVREVRIVDSDGAELFINRSILGDYQDITLT